VVTPLAYRHDGGTRGTAVWISVMRRMPRRTGTPYGAHMRVAIRMRRQRPVAQIAMRQPLAGRSTCDHRRVTDASLTRIIGRGEQLRSLEAFVRGIGQSGAALVVRGDAGVGKSTLLQYAANVAAGHGYQVLQVTGVPSEAHLPFAGLHRLLLPLRDQLSLLPPPQRQALAHAFGETSAESDFFLVALAALTLLGDAASATPVLVIADDVQWVDPPTCNVLAFVGRRLAADRIGLLMSSRPGTATTPGDSDLLQVHLTGLDDDAAASVLDAHTPGLPEALRRRVLRLAEGNPLALIELPRTAGELTTAALVPDALPLSTRLEAAFAARTAELGAVPRGLLLVAALDDDDPLQEILAATSAYLGTRLTPDDVTPAVDAGLLRVARHRLRFTHPLVRSAVAQAATAQERTAAHAALAGTLAGHADRRLWHLAAACHQPDETLAAALEEAADRASRLRDAAFAVAVYERAARLSESPQHRGSRLLHAAESAFDMGRHDVAARFVAEVATLDLEAAQRTRLAWLREQFHLGGTPRAVGLARFVDVIDQMRETGSHTLAVRSVYSLAMRAFWELPTSPDGALILRAIDRLTVTSEDPYLLAGMALVAPVERAAQIAERVGALTVGTDADAVRLLGVALNATGHLERAGLILHEAATLLRAQGRLGQLAQTLTSLAFSQLIRGDWDALDATADETSRLASETAQPIPGVVTRLTAAVATAWRGQPEIALQMADTEARYAAATGPVPVLALSRFVRGAAALAEGEHSRAFDELRRVFDDTEPAHHPHLAHLAVADLAEAAAACGRHDEALALLRQPIADTARTPSPLLRIGVRYAKAVLSADDTAEPAYRAALGQPTRDAPFIAARLRLSYGMWLRRQRRMIDCREPLRQARDEFDALGAGPWSERARVQLRAAGETSPSSPAPSHVRLTPQEYQVAQLAAEGFTNREIGERLFLSHRTVGSHLHTLFPKLGVTSRAQLAQALRRGTGERSTGP
jgi:DNA-binding CsgD family transcriptional regulator/tetratricopeptide (TPR) repeat protein